MIKPLLSFLLCLTLVAGLHAQRIEGTTPIGEQSPSRYLQNLPQGMIFYEGFENAQRPNLPNGWISQSNSNQGFISGTAGDTPGQTNENGFWPVPFHGIFAMSNDDVCNCDKSQDRLISPVIDARSYSSLWIFFSAFQNGSGNQRAFLEIKAQAEPWLQVFEIPASTQWQDYQVRIPTSYLKAAFQFRFVYSDQGNYASGLALDDIMLTTEIEESLKLLSLSPGGNGTNISKGQIQQSIPVKQARNISWRPEGKISNEGDQVKNARLSGSLTGPISEQINPIDWRVEPNTIANISGGPSGVLQPHLKGDYNLSCTLSTDSTDNNVNDNNYNTSFTVVDSNYHWFNQPNQFVLGSWLQSVGDRFGSSFSFYAPDSIVAINMGIHPSSQVGARFRFKIFDFDTLSSSVYSSSIFQIAAGDLGKTKRIAINTRVSIGRKLMVIEKESGSERLVIGLIHNQSATDSNSLSKKALENWRENPYFPQLEIITASPNPPCDGYLISEITQPSCFGVTDASISIEILGTTGNNSISWSNGSTNTNTISSIDTGNYQVTVTNSNGCVYANHFIIAYPDSLQVSPQIEADSCSSNNGSIALHISGGIKPYHVVWSGDTLGEQLTGLSAGTYPVVVSDLNGCSLTDTIEVIGSDSLSVSFSLTLPSCNDSNGSIFAEATGTGPFSFSWNNGVVGDTLSNIGADNYSVTITDSLGCVLKADISLPNLGAPTILLGSIAAETCFGFNDGAINIIVGGGTIPYEYTWSNGDLSEDLDSVNAGNYSLTLTDNQDCKTFASYEVARIGNPMFVDLNEKGNYCWKDNSGVLEALVSGGSAPYTFQWSNGSTLSKIEQLVAGQYTVTVSDLSGCTRSISSLVSEGPAFFILTDSLVEDTMVGAMSNGAIYVSLFGGTAPFEFIWNDSLEAEDLIEVENGIYELMVIDQLGCDLSLMVQLGIGPAGENALLNKENALSAYPNPILRGESMVIKSTEDLMNWTLIDIHGRQVDSGMIDHRNEITISPKRQGIFQLQVRTVLGNTFYSKVFVL